MAISRRRTCDLKTCEGLIEAYLKFPAASITHCRREFLGWDCVFAARQGGKSR